MSELTVMERYALTDVLRFVNADDYDAEALALLRSAMRKLCR
jgi:hypothetical protein